MPIDIAKGNVELARDDFVLPGRVPVEWTRLYRSSLLSDRSSPLGPGWTTSWFATLKRVEQTWQFSHEGVINSFPDPDALLDKGQVIRLLGAFLELVRQDDRYIVTNWDVESEEINRFIFSAERGAADPALMAVENVSGDGVELTWDPAGRLSRLRQRTENRTVLLNYSKAGLVSSLDLVTREGAGTELVRYEYDEAGRFSAAFDRRDLANRYEYDAQSRLSREVLKDGAVYSYRYDNRSRCIHFTGLDHYNEKRLRFLDSANRTMVTNSYGKTSVYEYLPSGQIASEIDPLGNQRRTAFDEWGRIVAKIDPLDGTTRYTYDESGNRDSITDPLGNANHFKFNAHHQPVSLTNPLGKTWGREYDVKHRLIATSNPLGARWKVDYDEANNPVVITDPRGARRRQRFSNGLLTEMTDWMGYATCFQWDAFGRVVERVGPTGARTGFRYDPVGNPIEVELPDGGRLRATYDSGDNLNSFTNATGLTSHFRYGPCRRLLERADPIGRMVSFQWGTETERLDSVINEKGEIFSYFHDGTGRVVREVSFDGREQSFKYGASGHCLAFTNGNGEEIIFVRDAAGQLSRRVLPDGTSTAFEYDPAGRMVAAINSDIPVAFMYDDADQLIRETQGDHWIQTRYNSAGEVICTFTSLGHEVRYDLDPNGRVGKLSVANEQSITFEHNALGLEVRRQMPGGMQLQQRYDLMGRLLEQGVERNVYSHVTSLYQVHEHRQVIKRDYRYDADGLLLRLADSRWGVTDYVFDPAERLLSILREHGSNEKFEYDATDNLTRIHREMDGINEQTAVYGAGNRLIQFGEVLYQFDAEGQLVRKTEPATSGELDVWEYFWDAQGQLRKIRRPDGQEWEYKYDAFSRRVAKIGSQASRRFLWDGDSMIQELDDQNLTVAWIMDRHSFAPIAKIEQKSLCPIITDHLGTPREMFDASGTLVWVAEFKGWGQTERKQTQRSGYECPIRFQGQWFDQESGLHYNRYRYYDPGNGRFLSPDPARAAGGHNLFQYVRNPVMWFDPFGLAECGDENSGKKKGAKRGPKTDPDAPHNKTIRAEAERLKAEGNTIIAGGGEKELLIPTPGGNKEGRRPDILYQTPEGELRGLNVGRTKADGTPVPREAAALNDLNGPGGLPTTFVPYDRK